MSNVKVDIIMPVFNRAKIIKRAIVSIQKQTYINWNLLIIDDKSTDNTKLIIDEFSKKDSRIKYYFNDGKKGVSGARNIGLKNVDSKYVAFLDSDDEWLENHLENSIHYLEQYNLNAIFSLWFYKSGESLISINKKNSCIKKINENETKICTYNDSNISVFNKQFYSYSILNPIFFYHLNTLVFETDKIKEIGYFNEKLKTSEDIDFIYKVFFYCKFALLKEEQYIYYEGMDNLYNLKGRMGKSLEEILNEKSLVVKMFEEGRYKNLMRITRLRFIYLHKVEYKKECIEKIRCSIQKKYLFLYILSKIQSKKLYSYKFLFLSFFINPTKSFFSIISNFKGKKIFIEDTKKYLDIS